MKKYSRFLGIFFSVLLIIAVATPSIAATTAVVTITYTPQFIGISISPTTWTVNGINGGNSKVQPSTTYYSNPLGDTTAPTAGGAVDGECQFTITNTANVAIDIKVTSSDASGGSDNMTNGNTGSAGATSYGMTSYFTGQASGAWVISKSSGTSIALSNLAATTNIKCGLIFATQSNAWSGSTSSTLTSTFAATAH